MENTRGILLRSKNKIIVLGYYAPSEHEATRILDGGGIYPTVKENHGTVPAVLVEVKDGISVLSSSNYDIQK